MKEKNKEAYVSAEVEIIRFDSTDVITTSGGPDSSDTDFEGGVEGGW